MNASFGKLLSAVYELEGLLLVFEKHGEDTPALVIDAIKEKAALISQEAQDLKETSDETSVPTDNVFPFENKEEAQDALEDNDKTLYGNKEKSEISFDENVISDGNEVEEEENLETPPELPAPETTVDEEKEEDDAKEDGTTKDPITVVNTEVLLHEIDDDEPEFSNDNENDDSEEEDEEEQEEVDDEEKLEEVVDDDDEVEEEEEDDDDDDDDDVVSVEDKTSLAKDMRKAISPNDSVRFRRELFGNIAADFNDALNVINAMQDYDEATEYFYDYLGFDPQNEDVVAFMAIVKKHFQQ